MIKAKAIGKKGTYTLDHHVFVDTMGLRRDALTLVLLQKDGLMVNIPFFGDLKVSTKGRNDDIRNMTNKYTQADFRSMLKREMDKWESYEERNTKTK